MHKTLAGVALAGIWFGLGAAQALAQQAPAESATRAAPRPASEGPNVILEAHSNLAFRTDVRSEEADVLVSHTGASATISGPITPTLRLTFTVDGEFSYYDFGDASSIMPGGDESFEDLYTAGVLLGANYTISGPWSVTGGGFVRTAGESDADAGEAIFGGGFFGVGYAFSERSRLTIGAAVSTQLEDDVVVYPYISIYHQITDTLRLESRGLGLALVKSVNQHFDVAIKAAYEARQFRLNDDRPSWESGVVRDNRVPVGVELAWRPTPQFILSLEGGAVVYQEFEFLDSGGDELNDFETEPAPFVGLRLEWRF